MTPGSKLEHGGVGSFLKCNNIQLNSLCNSPDFCWALYTHYVYILLFMFTFMLKMLGRKNITENMYLLKMSGPQIRFCLFTFRPIASKQLNSLTTLLTWWCSGNASALGTICPGFNLRLRQGFLCCCFLYCCCCF